MKTLVLTEPGVWSEMDSPEPCSPGCGEALVRVDRVGVCGTDLHAFRGRQPFFQYPRILGHELGVTVLSVGRDVTNVSPGDRCAVEPYLNCGSCGPCLQGKSNCCTKLQVLGVHTDGGHRERMLIPANKLHPGAGLTLEQLALVETLGIGAHAVDRARIVEGETVIVAGAGPIGLAVMQFLTTIGTQIIVLDPNPDRREFASKIFQLEAALDPDDGLEDQLLEITAGMGPSIVFEATGNRDSMRRSIGLCGSGGRVVFVGLVLGDIAFDDPTFHRKELTLLASRNSTPKEFQNIIAGMQSGAINTNPWVTHRIPFADVPARFERLYDPAERVVKAVIEMG